MWHGEYTIGLQHLKSFKYLPQECQQMQQISDAYGGLFGVASISRLWENENLEDAPSAVLSVSGRSEATVFDSYGEEAVECD